MTQEQKELLLKDLCARLPYGVMVNVQYKDGDGWKSEDRRILGIYEDGQVYLDCVYTTVDCIKPYLRPMSSMTNEELNNLSQYSGLVYDNFILESFQNDTYKCLDFYLTEVPTDVVILVFDWLNKNHFDYRGLIVQALAIEVTKENNPYKY